MAITGVYEVPLSEHTARFDSSGQAVTRPFYVLSDAPATDWPFAIQSATYGGTSIPQIGDVHPGASRLRVRNHDLRPEGDGTKTLVLVRYDTRTDIAGLTFNSFGFGSNGSGQNPPTGQSYAFVEDPLERVPKLSFREEFIQVIKRADLVSDNDGSSWTACAGMTNSAGQTFDPPIVEDKPIMVGVLTKNLTTFNLAIARSYSGAVNSDVFCGFAPRYCLLKSWTGERIFESNVWYWRHTFEVWFNDTEWDEDILDQGLGYLDGGELTAATDPNDYTHGQPVRLDGSGGIIASAATASHYRKFRYTEKELPFSVLDIA
jgi:hypothetical protein